MYDDDTEKMHVAVKNASSTHARVGALKKLSTTDFHKTMFASGILIRLRKLDGTSLTDGMFNEFVIAAEDMEKIKVEIIASLQRSLTLHKAHLQSEINDIEAALSPPSKQSN